MTMGASMWPAEPNLDLPTGTLCRVQHLAIIGSHRTSEEAPHGAPQALVDYK
jgi:hypothetical protein